MILKKEELKEVVGGAAFSAAFGSMLLKAFELVSDFGRYIGSSFNYLINGKKC